MKTEKIISVSLEDEKTVKTVKEVYEPRYEGFVGYDEVECDFVIEDFKTNHKAWIGQRCRDYSGLDTKENWQPDEEAGLSEDLVSFQEYLDKTYGKDKYEAFTFGAYSHSGVAFGFSKGRYVNQFDSGGWDSSTIGFVGLSKEILKSTSKDTIASWLSDAYNGAIERMWVYDNLDDDIVDEINSLSSREEINDWKQSMEEKYGVKDFQQQ